MSSLRPGLSGLLVLAVAATTVGVLAARATAATSTGEIVLPPYQSLDLPTIGYLAGSDGGLVWKKNDDALRYLPTGTSQVRTAEQVSAPFDVSVSGDHLTYRLGRAHNPDNVDSPWTEPGPAVQVDLSTGARQELSHDANDYGSMYAFRGGSDGTWLEDRNAGIVRLNTDGTSRTYALPADAPTAAQGYLSVPTGAIDDAGSVLWLRGDGYQKGFLAYLDFATGAWSKLVAGIDAHDALLHVGMTDSAVAWPVGSTLNWVTRSAPGVVHTKDLGSPIVDLAMAGGRIAVATQAAGSPIVVRLGTLTGALTAVAPPMPVKADVVPIGGGGLGVVAGQSPANYGVYRLVPGSADLGPAVVLFGPNPPTYLAASVGQLGVGTLRKDGDPVVRTITVNTDEQHNVTTVKAGDERVLAGQGVGPSCSRSGVYTVCLKNGGPNEFIQEVRQDGRLVGDFVVPDSAGGAQLIERGLLVTNYCAGDLGCTDYSELINLDTGARTRLPYVAAVNGDTIYYVTNAGEIRSRDLGTGAESVIRPAGFPALETHWSLYDYFVAVNGDWVKWFIRGAPGAGSVERTAESVAINLRTHQRVDLTNVDTGARGYPNLKFAAGVVAWTDDAFAVHVLDLTNGNAAVVGSIGARRSAIQLALTSEWVAWMVADGSIHVRPLRDIQAGTPHWSGTIDAPTFSTVAEPYAPVGDTNRPLGAWTMTIRSAVPATTKAAVASASKVRTLTGSARTGDVTPVWDGKDSKGHVVPDGVYTWTLTGTGPGGSLQTSGAAPRTVTGTVTVDSTTPTPRFAAPASGKTTGVALRWKSTEHHVTYTVKVSVGTKDKHGGWHYAKAKTWLRGVPTTTATYVNGKTTPVDLTKGHRYRFTATATDLAGNKASRTRTVAIN